MNVEIGGTSCGGILLSAAISWTINLLSQFVEGEVQKKVITKLDSLLTPCGIIGAILVNIEE